MMIVHLLKVMPIVNNRGYPLQYCIQDLYSNEVKVARYFT